MKSTKWFEEFQRRMTRPQALWRRMGTIGDPKKSLAHNPGGRSYPRVSASHTSPWDKCERAIDGEINFLPEPNNRWTSYLSASPTDWLEVDFGEAKSFGRVDLGIYDDRIGVTAPRKWWIEIWTEGDWKTVENKLLAPANPTGGMFNRARFSPVTTSRFRVVFEHNGAGRSGITELLAWPN